MSTAEDSLLGLIQGGVDGKPYTNPITSTGTAGDQFKYHLTDRTLIGPVPGRPGIFIKVEDADTIFEGTVDGEGVFHLLTKPDGSPDGDIRSKWTDAAEIGNKTGDKVTSEPEPYAASQAAVTQKAIQWAVDNGWTVNNDQIVGVDIYKRKIACTTFFNPATGEEINFNALAIENGWMDMSFKVADEKMPNASLTVTKYGLQAKLADAQAKGIGIFASENRIAKLAYEVKHAKKIVPLELNSKMKKNPHYDLSLDKYESMYKIGDVWLNIPPTHMSINQLRSSYNIPLLGFESKPVQAALTNRIIIKLNTIFDSEGSINTDLKRILMQFKYVPINIIRSRDLFDKLAGKALGDGKGAGEASWLRSAYDNTGDYCVPVTMDSYTLYTIEGHPGCIGCSLQFSLFNFSAYFNSDQSERMRYFKFDIDNFDYQSDTGVVKLASGVDPRKIWDKTVDLEDSIHPYNFMIESKIRDSHHFTTQLENKSDFCMTKIEKSSTQKEGTVLADSKESVLDGTLKIFADSTITDIAHSISITYENNFAWQPLLGFAQPIAQYIGPGETQISVNIKTGNKDNIAKYLKTYADKIDPGRYGFYDDRYLCEASLLNFADTKVLSMQNVSVHNLEGKPGWFDVNLMFNKSTFNTLVLEGNEPQARDKYWGLNKIFGVLDQPKVAAKLAEMDKVNQENQSASAIYQIPNPDGKDINGLNISFSSDVNTALEFIRDNWGTINDGVYGVKKKEGLITSSPDNVATAAKLSKVKGSPPIPRMKVVQGKLQENEVKDNYQWQALKGRKEIQDKYGTIVFSVKKPTSGDMNTGANELNNMLAYEQLSKTNKLSIDNALSESNQGLAAAMDGRIFAFDFTTIDQKEVEKIKSVFEKGKFFSKFSGYESLVTLKCKTKPQPNNVTRFFITSADGNTYNDSNSSLSKDQVIAVMSKEKMDELRKEIQSYVVPNRPFAAHRYFDGIDLFIHNNLIGSRTVGYWYANNRLETMEKQIGQIVDTINKVEDPFHSTDAWKAVYVKNAKNGSADSAMGGLVDQENPYSTMKGVVLPTLKKDLTLYEQDTMLINQGIIDKALTDNSGDSYSDDFAFTSWSDNLLNNDYLGSGAELKRYTDAYAKNIASRVEYGIPAGTAGQLEDMHDGNNGMLGVIKTGSTTLARKSSFNVNNMSGGVLQDLSNVSTPIMKPRAILLMNQYVMSQNKNPQFTTNPFDDDEYPTDMRAQTVASVTTTAPIVQMPKAGVEDVMLTTTNYTGIPGASTSESFRLQNGTDKNEYKTTAQAYGDAVKNASAQQKDIDILKSHGKGDNEISAFLNRKYFNGASMEDQLAAKGKGRNTGVSGGTVDDLVNRHMYAQQPTFGLQNAHPTFKMYIISDESSEYKLKMLDMYWDYRLVQDLMVIRDKNNPSHILKARVLVDPRYTTTTPRVNQRINTARDILESKQPVTPEAIVEGREVSYIGNRSPLRQGMRICIKLGYHTDPRALDTVFIGTITGLSGAQEHGIYNLEARGDGRELLVPATISDSSLHGDNFADLINMMLRSNPNVLHFGKVYGSFLERFSRDHQEWIKFIASNIPTEFLFTSAAASLAITALTPVTAAVGVAAGLSGGWLCGIGIAAVATTAGIASFDGRSAHTLLDKMGYNWQTYDVGHKIDNWFGDLGSRLKGQTFNASKASYQLTKHMHHMMNFGNNPIDDNIFAVDIFAQGQGKNVNLKVNNQKSIWDVLVNIKRIYPGWALDVRPYGNRSTLFLGPVSFNYWRTDDPLLAMAPSLIQMEEMKSFTNNQQYMEGINNALRSQVTRTRFSRVDVCAENADKGIAPFVPFIKHHSVSSFEDIIHNGIYCTPSRGWNSVVVAKAGNAEPEEYLANEGLFKSSVRRKFEIVDWTSDDRLRKQYAIGLLKEGVEKLYGGTLILRGNSKIEPYDRIQICDNVNRMYGTIEVETVIHKYDSEMGFTTHIVPNMVCAINDSSYLTMGDITKRAALDMWKKADGWAIAEGAAFIAAGAFVPFWPLLGLMSVYEIGKMIKNNVDDLNKIATVTDKTKGVADDGDGDVGWAIKAREISVRNNIHLAEAGTGAFLRMIYDISKGSGTIDWRGLAAKAKPTTASLASMKNGAKEALSNLKTNAALWKEYATVGDYFTGAMKLPQKLWGKMFGAKVADAAVLTAAEDTAVKSFSKVISRFGGPILKTGIGVATFMAFESLPLIYETYVFKAATKNQIISVKPLWSKDSLMMQGLEGYKNSDAWMHMKDVAINMGEVGKEAWSAVTNFKQRIITEDGSIDKETWNFGEAAADTFVNEGYSEGPWSPDEPNRVGKIKNIEDLVKSDNFKKFQPLVLKAHQRYPGVPTAMINAVLKKECGFDMSTRDGHKTNKNGSQDHGVMQINDIHADEYASFAPRGVGYYGNNAAIEKNVMFGVSLLSGHMHATRNPLMAFWRYNGTGRPQQEYAVPALKLYQQFAANGA